MMSGYFDTTTGAKVTDESYKKIADQIGVAVNEVLFLTDVDKGRSRVHPTTFSRKGLEALAAKEAGMQVRIVVRPGNAPLSDGVTDKFTLLHDFSQLL